MATAASPRACSPPTPPFKQMPSTSAKLCFPCYASVVCHPAALLLCHPAALIFCHPAALIFCHPAAQRRDLLFVSARTKPTPAPSLPPPPPDLIVTHFFLDCLTQPELDALVARLAAPGVLWLISDFRIPSGLLHWPARIYIRVLYFAFRILTGLRITHLPNHARALRSKGFNPIAIQRNLFGLLTTELWSSSS